METLIAYIFARDAWARVAVGCVWVEVYYGDFWQYTADYYGYDSQLVGLYLWDRLDCMCRWLFWQDIGDFWVASVHAPFGYQRVIGDVVSYDAFVLLAKVVWCFLGDFFELVLSFIMAVLDLEAQRLDLFTDSIGVGRLFQLWVLDGWVWTNRPVAALLFAGVSVAAASRGWMFAAACGWFMDDSTPYEGVLTVPGATYIVADGYCQQRTVSRIETISIWSIDKTDIASVAEEIVVVLQDVARSVAALWLG